MPKKQQVVLHMGPKKQKQKSRRSKGGGGGGLIPGSVQRDRLNQIQELWTPLFPARSTRRIRYSTNTGGLTSTSGAMVSYVFSANGLFDPDITSTGHQPMGFDQIMLSYEHYVVTNCRLIATFRNTNASNLSVGLSVQPSNTSTTDIDRLIETGALQRDTLEFKGVNGSVKTLETRVDMKRIMGRRSLVDDTDLQGDANNNPTEQTYIIVHAWDAGATTGTCFVDVTMEFTAIFMEPRPLTVSTTAALKALIASEQKVVTH